MSYRGSRARASAAQAYAGGVDAFYASEAAAREREAALLSVHVTVFSVNCLGNICIVYTYIYVYIEREIHI